MTPLSPLPIRFSCCALRRAADGHPRHLRGECRASGSGEGPRNRPGRHRLDDHQLLARLRQPAAARRTRRRPARPPTRLPCRPGGVHRFVARSRRSPATRRCCSPRAPGRASAPRCCRPPRCRSSRRLPRPGARQGARRLGCGRRRRCRRRRPARRRAHRAGRLARDLLHQPPGRPRPRGWRHAHPARRHRAAAVARPRSPRRAARHGQPRRPRLRPLPGADSAGWTSTQTLGIGAVAIAGLAAVRRARATHRPAAAASPAPHRPRRSAAAS